MKKEDLVPRLETCKKLKELGYPQDTSFHHIKLNNGHISLLFSNEAVIPYMKNDSIAAPTASELGQWLPLWIKHKNKGCEMHQGKCADLMWFLDYLSLDCSVENRIEHSNEAELRAQMLIWLIEKNHYQFPLTT